MAIVLLVFLGVDLIVLVVSLPFVLGRKRWATRQLIAIDTVGEHRPAAPGYVERFCSDPIVVVLKAGTATLQIVAYSDALDRVSGPFRPAEAGHV